MLTNLRVMLVGRDLVSNTLLMFELADANVVESVRRELVTNPPAKVFKGDIQGLGTVLNAGDAVNMLGPAIPATTTGTTQTAANAASQPATGTAAAAAAPHHPEVIPAPHHPSPVGNAPAAMAPAGQPLPTQKITTTAKVNEAATSAPAAEKESVPDPTATKASATAPPAADRR